MAGKRGPYGSYRPEVTRKRLLDAALNLFGGRGYKATTVQQIVDRAKVTKGAFYHHFDSKDDVLQQIHYEFASTMLGAAKEIEALDLRPAEQLRALIERAVITYGTYRLHVAVFFQEYRFLKNKSFALIKDMHIEERAITRRLISRAMEVGELRPGVDERMILFAISGVTAWVYQWYQPRGEMKIEDIASWLADIILFGVVSPDLADGHVVPAVAGSGQPGRPRRSPVSVSKAAE